MVSTKTDMIFSNTSSTCCSHTNYSNRNSSNYGGEIVKLIDLMVKSTYRITFITHL